MKKKIARRWLRKMEWKIAKTNIGMPSLSYSDKKYHTKCIRALLKDD